MLDAVDVCVLVATDTVVDIEEEGESEAAEALERLLELVLTAVRLVLEDESVMEDIEEATGDGVDDEKSVSDTASDEV